MPFLTKTHHRSLNPPTTTIPFSWVDYLELVDWTGRAIREEKRGHIDNKLPTIFHRLHLDVDQWLKQHHQLENHYPTFMGQWRELQAACEKLHRKWCKGMTQSRLLFGA